MKYRNNKRSAVFFGFLPDIRNKGHTVFSGFMKDRGG